MTESTVFVIDDDPAVRKSLDMLLRAVGLPARTFARAEEFLEQYGDGQPGCLVLDVRMPGISGPELQRMLNERGVAIPVIFVTGHGDVPIAVRAMKDGAIDFIEKPFSKQLLVEHIRKALALDERRRSASALQTSIEARLAALSSREREVMALVVAGKLSKEIAAALGISKKTVDVHRAHVMHKLNVASVAELVDLALRARQPAPARAHPVSSVPAVAASRLET